MAQITRVSLDLEAFCALVSGGIVRYQPGGIEDPAVEITLDEMIGYTIMHGAVRNACQDRKRKDITLG